MDAKIIVKWETQVKKGILDFILLLVLKDRVMYGYELLEYTKRMTGYEMAEGTIYPLLNRLRDDGLIDSKWVEMETGMPRKYYSITPAGLSLLENMKTFWTSLVNNLEKLV
jgi:PadR family transcriptional regulator, regulatory protein PadR